MLCLFLMQDIFMDFFWQLFAYFLEEKYNYLASVFFASDKREICLFSPPDCGGQGDHGHSFLSVKVENIFLQNVFTIINTKRN